MTVRIATHKKLLQNNKRKVANKVFIKKRTMKTKTLLFTAIVSIAFISSAQAQNVNIPDANFKAALVANASVNTNMDAEIQVSEASVFNGAINVSGLGISDLTGIEAFVLLDSLDCRFNPLISFDVYANTVLTYINCGPFINDNMGFEDSIDFSANTMLTYLNCSGVIGLGVENSLSSINVTGLNNLTYLDCGANVLVSLDVSTNTSLNYLDCSSACVNGGIGSDFAQLINLNLSGAIALTYLDCSFDGNGFQGGGPGGIEQSSFGYLDVSTNTALTYINCSRNVLTSLDVSACTALTTLDCGGNNLTNLNVKNGNNINFINFMAGNNPNLSCIEVDSAAWSNANWAFIDPSASFSENCSAVGILDNNESNAPIFYPNPTTGTIYLSEPANISLSDFSGKLLLEQKNTNQLDISSLPAGMYFLSFGENNKHTFKVIKE